MPALRLLPDLEDAIRHLPGVQAASVVTDADARPTEVHVLASPGKAAKQVVRDVQSLALARYEIDLNHRIVSVVQIGDEEPVDTDEGSSDDSPSTEPSRRPAIAAVGLRTAGQEATASVTLRLRDDVFEGTQTGGSGVSQRARLVALATLEAVQELLGVPCQVESAQVVPAGPRSIALSVLTLSVPRLGEQVVTGCAVVRGDEADAVARSVLAALNRQLTG